MERQSGRLRSSEARDFSRVRVHYSQKLSQIFALNNIRSVTLLRMEVPCCGGLVRMTQEALNLSGKDIAFKVIAISRAGKVINS